MKRFLPLLIAAAVIISGCGKEDGPNAVETRGVFVLNNGSYGNNDSGIGVYDPSSGAFSSDVFESVNGIRLGDTAQDILVDGDRVYIAVYGSKLVFVTDRKLKVLDKVVAMEGENTLSPRRLARGGDRIYVTYYEGFLGEIDPSSLAVRTTPVGANPEGVAFCDGKLYVANSGGMNYPAYDNTVSVVSASSFTSTGKITVNCNPQTVLSCGGNVYVSSYGNYAEIPAKLQKIVASTGAVSDLDYSNPSDIAIEGDRMYILCGGYDESWNPLPGTVHVHDAATDTKTGPLLKDGTVLKDAYSISAAKGFVWVGCSDYKNTGTVYVISPEDGTAVDSFDSGGMNALRVAW